MYDTKTTNKRHEILERANDRNFTLTINGKKYAAKLAGSKLDYPFVWCRMPDGTDKDCQINWRQAEQLAEGTITNINYSA